MEACREVGDSLHCRSPGGEERRYDHVRHSTSTHHACVQVSEHEISCSGVVMQMVGGFYNPLTPFDLIFERMAPFREDFGGARAYYYLEDVRTEFVMPVLGLRCSDPYSTCVDFSNATICFGGPAGGLSPIGAGPALLVGGLVGLAARNKYCLAALGVCLVLEAVHVASIVPLLLGALLVSFARQVWHK